MDVGFGNWLSGITDGEGCFYIELVKPNQHQNYIKYRGGFRLGLRADDYRVINDIRSGLGFGKIYYKVSSISDCCKLIDVFDKFKLRSKKLKDYTVWREFILYKRDNFYNRHRLEDYVNTLGTFYKEMIDVRRFTEKRED